MNYIDPGKLRFAELRDELKAQGLDTKGVDAVLVQRLREVSDSDGGGADNCDLNLRVEDGGFRAHPLTVEGFAFMWAGAQAMFEVKAGKVAYEVKLLENLNVDHLPSEETHPHVLRVGWSADDTSIQLCEKSLSFGSGSTGKASAECQFKDYGERFTAGDVITAYLEEPFFPLQEGYIFLESLSQNDGSRVRGSSPPATKEDCEILTIVGFSGCGKPTWAEKHTIANLDKKCNVLGTSNIIDKMKVMGLPKKNYSGHWYILNDMSAKCLNHLIEIAARKKRNYILDQTDVYVSTQRRKMQPFEGFQRKAVVVVPTDMEFKRCIEKREKEEWKEIPEQAALETNESGQLESVQIIDEQNVGMVDPSELSDTYKEEACELAPPHPHHPLTPPPPPEKFVEDHYNVVYEEVEDRPELNPQKKCVKRIMILVKIILVLGCLYFFICSLDFMSSAFKLVGGKKVGEVLQQSHILANPIAGLMIGLLATVLLQSSSTSTSIVISMVGASVLTARMAVPMVMGANIGTSVTNTVVALGYITSKNGFRRAFAGATVHDMFNWLTVIVLLPVEIVSGYLYHLSDAIVTLMHLKEKMDTKQDLLQVITKPFTNLIVQVSSLGIKNIATNKTMSHQVTLMKFCCDNPKPDRCCKDKLDYLKKNLPWTYSGAAKYSISQKEGVCQAISGCVKEYNVASPNSKLSNCTEISWKKISDTVTYPVNALNCSSLEGNSTETECCMTVWTRTSYTMDVTRNLTEAQQAETCTRVNGLCYQPEVDNACLNASSWQAGRNVTKRLDDFDCMEWYKVVEGGICLKPCEFLFRSAHVNEGGPFSDKAIGAILLLLALLMLCMCLLCIVNLLHSLMQGPVARVIKNFVNSDFPGYCAYFTGYLAILIGAGMTILLQSSSIFTSTLTPLVGMGVISLDRMYPLTLGSNIGTTFTGVLSALAQDSDRIPISLQVAFCHLFFNITGIMLFYPLPFFRPPVPAAKFLGNITAKYRWFAIFYLIVGFFAFPAAVFALSMLSWYVLAGTLVPVLLLVIMISIIKCFQAKCPECLPQMLRDWDFLPLSCRSLEPYDKVMKRIFFCHRFQDEPRVNNSGPTVSTIAGISARNITHTPM